MSFLFVQIHEIHARDDIYRVSGVFPYFGRQLNIDTKKHPLDAEGTLIFQFICKTDWILLLRQDQVEVPDVAIQPVPVDLHYVSATAPWNIDPAHRRVICQIVL